MRMPIGIGEIAAAMYLEGKRVGKAEIANPITGFELFLVEKYKRLHMQELLTEYPKEYDRITTPLQSQ